MRCPGPSRIFCTSPWTPGSCLGTRGPLADICWATSGTSLSPARNGQPQRAGRGRAGFARVAIALCSRSLPAPSAVAPGSQARGKRRASSEVATCVLSRVFLPVTREPRRRCPGPCSHVTRDPWADAHRPPARRIRRADDARSGKCFSRCCLIAVHDHVIKSRKDVVKRLHDSLYMSFLIKNKSPDSYKL